MSTRDLWSIAVIYYNENEEMGTCRPVVTASSTCTAANDGQQHASAAKKEHRRIPGSLRPCDLPPGPESLCRQFARGAWTRSTTSTQRRRRRQRLPSSRGDDGGGNDREGYAKLGVEELCISPGTPNRSGHSTHSTYSSCLATVRRSYSYRTTVL